MKRSIKKTIAGAILFAFVILAGLITLIFYPQSLFANKFEHNQFVVYYGKNNKFEKEEFALILDNAYQLIEKSELHDPEYKFKIFLAHDNIFNKIEGLQGGGVIARATAGNITCKVVLDIKNDRVYTERSTVNLTELLVHEMVHILQANKYGLYNFSPIKHPPMWKLEGYPEYVARNSLLKSEEYSLQSEIHRFISSDDSSKQETFEAVKGHFMPTYYFKGRIMVEYLMDTQGLSYEEILNDNRTEEEVFNEMIDWAKTQDEEK